MSEAYLWFHAWTNLEEDFAIRASETLLENSLAVQLYAEQCVIYNKVVSKGELLTLRQALNLTLHTLWTAEVSTRVTWLGLQSALSQ